MIRVEGVPSEMSDEALIAACGAGANAALGALYDRHAPAVRRFLARLSGTDDRDLDDLVQATFEVVVGAAKKFDHRSTGRTWLLGIANNTARHHVRTEVRRRRLVEEATAGATRGESADPRSEAAQHQRAARLQEAILALPLKLREAFVLVYLEGLPGAEVARMLDAREGTIWKRLHEARAKLRVVLEGERS
ncbi:MAG: RNA polymerase sigma factor [Kofleriaceae bacterium]